MAEHLYKVVPNTAQEKIYRCKVVGNAAATLFVGPRSLKVFVRETCGGGFTLGLDPKQVKKIKLGTRYELHYDDRRLLITPQVFVPSVEGEPRLQVVTVHEYEPKKRWAFRLPFTKGQQVKKHETIGSAAAYGGFVLVLFCVMALPGVGDKLGTAPRIEAALNLMAKNFSDVFKSVRS
ncbi:hypothetical protein [Rhodopirellula sp. MGV]|uniref:hypothetical protein n=1 Tax=Rhodopirellula sp. MGV TaxID=2023130 RepID=UPI000B9602EA|nr:hypothetical protein [Rhodopirellula sp. MGV]OYP34419.1 hypothetical protein CGZ80_15325 [Rhodopirellula sp. MGV]PNY37406.1 hypothetical protein C2E31_07700 [Rhodopirellula baltica]